jgi:hypothetical protein
MYYIYIYPIFSRFPSLPCLALSCAMVNKNPSVAAGEVIDSERITLSGWDVLRMSGQGRMYELDAYISQVDGKLYVSSSEAYAFIRAILPTYAECFLSSAAYGWKKANKASQTEPNLFRSFYCMEKMKIVTCIPLSCVLCHIQHSMVEKDNDQLSTWHCLQTACMPDTWDSCADQKRILGFVEVRNLYALSTYILSTYTLSTYFYCVSSKIFIYIYIFRVIGIVGSARPNLFISTSCLQPRSKQLFLSSEGITGN